MRSGLSLTAACFAAGAIGCTSGPPIPVGGNNGGGGTTRRTGTSRGGGSSKSSMTEGTSASSGGTTSSSTAATTSSGPASSSGSSTSAGLVCGASGGGSGTNQLFNCTNVAAYAGDAGSCATVWLGSQVIDFETCSPVCGATVEAVNPSGVTIGGSQQLSSLPSGDFEFCLPPETTFETTVSAPGYSHFVYGEIQGQLAVGIPILGMLSNDELSAFSVFISGGLNPATGALVAFFVFEDSCGGTSPEAGWSISLSDENGAPYPDGGYTTLYINGSGFPDPTLTQTSPYGVTLIYGIDPSVAQFPTVHATNPASSCEVVNQLVGFTGRIQVGAGLFSEQGIFLE